MKKTLQIVIIFTLICTPKSFFGQQSSEQLYDKLDRFVANPSLELLKKFEQTTTLFEKNSNDADRYLAVVIAKTNIAYYYQQFGDLNQSIISYENAWSLFEKHHLNAYDIFENCLLPLSKIYTQQGDFLKAEELLKRCYFHSESTDNIPLLCQITLSISALNNTLGNYNAAITFIYKALLLKGISTNVKHQLENNLAASYIGNKNYTKAKELLLHSIKYQKSANSYKSLAFIALKENNIDLANSYFNQAEIALQNQNYFSGRDFILLAIEKSELLLAVGKNNEAQKELQHVLKMILPEHSGLSLPKKNTLIADRNLVRIFDIYAETLQTTEEKLKVYDLSFYVENLLVTSYVSQETKIIHQTSHKKRTEKCVDLLWKAHLQNKNSEYIQKAFQYAENSKASVLLEKIYENKNESQDSKSEQQKRLLAQREKLTDDLLRIQFKQLGNHKADEIVAEIQTIDREITSLKASDSKKIKENVINFKQLQHRIEKDKATLVSYFIGKESSYQFSIDKNNIKMSQLSTTKDFELKIKNFISYFDGPSSINNNISSYTTSAYNTYKLLQLNNLPHTPNLVVIPDGLLNFLPFESLLTAKSTSISFSEMPFLVKEKSVAYTYNAFDYLNESTAKKDQSILGVFPVFENSPQALNYSIDEAKAINDQFIIVSLFKSNATKKNFIDKAKTASILHLSTHAGSGDYIVPANIQFIDDVLYLPELYSLDMSGKTVVLSACETGIGKLLSGEGAISIARGFSYAGADKVLFTLWEVNDKSTSEVMAAFYKALKNSNSVFKANHESKLDYLFNPDISNHKKSPYYWNSFTYYGAIDEKQNSFKYWWVLIGVLIVLSLVIVYKIFKKHC